MRSARSGRIPQDEEIEVGTTSPHGTCALAEAYVCRSRPSNSIWSMPPLIAEAVVHTQWRPQWTHGTRQRPAESRSMVCELTSTTPSSTAIISASIIPATTRAQDLHRSIFTCPKRPGSSLISRRWIHKSRRWAPQGKAFRSLMHRSEKSPLSRRHS